MEKKQTAVQWFNESMQNSVGMDQHQIDKIFEQALQIEREQIFAARQDGHESTYSSCESGCKAKDVLGGSHETYYLETFKP